MVDRILRDHADDRDLKLLVARPAEGLRVPGAMAARDVVVQAEDDDIVVHGGTSSERVSRVELAAAFEARGRVVSAAAHTPARP